MEFKEFNDPLEEDYDINSSYNESNFSNEKEPTFSIYSERLMDLVGILEDEEHLDYGMTLEEYIHPTEETIKKVEDYINNKSR